MIQVGIKRGLVVSSSRIQVLGSDTCTKKRRIFFFVKKKNQVYRFCDNTFFSQSSLFSKGFVSTSVFGFGYQHKNKKK